MTIFGFVFPEIWCCCFREFDSSFLNSTYTYSERILSLEMTSGVWSLKWQPWSRLSFLGLCSYHLSRIDWVFRLEDPPFMISKVIVNEILLVPDVGFFEVGKLVERCGSSTPIALWKSVPCHRPFSIIYIFISSPLLKLGWLLCWTSRCSCKEALFSLWRCFPMLQLSWVVSVMHWFVCIVHPTSKWTLLLNFSTMFNAPFCSVVANNLH